ncbi:DUF581 domain-containing protein [Cephalotus follicularis]|uniref:DUF581 domain-containing protein n=1 Tax=Cephalotus follicularis TaxID=3775 RepID=A0A1Q3BUZ0_CEPFO|nr:DUF581 domain-containing protein [Cephalotus follicularis]
MASFSYSSSPRSGKSFSYNHQESHFLEACFLCNRPLGLNSDIFMYRGNTPFCSNECRQEQIEIDEGKEKSWKLSTSRSLTQSDSKTSTKSVRTGTLVVA